MNIGSNIIAHRGIFDNVHTIENTLESFQKAIDCSYPFELDVQMTQDRHLVVFHDDTLKRLAGRGEHICDLTYDELKKIPLLQTKNTIPLLKDVLLLNHDQVYIDIEIKNTNHYVELVNLLMKELEGYTHFIIKSFQPSIVRYIKKNYPNIMCGLLIHSHYSKWWRNCYYKSHFILQYTHADFVAISKKLYHNKRYLKKLKNLPVFIWTVMDENEIPMDQTVTAICNNLPYKK